VAARSEAWVCSRLLAGIAGSNPAGEHGYLFRVCYVLSGTDLCVGPIPRPGGPTDCGVSECELEVSIMRRSWPTWGCCNMGKIIIIFRIR
jgi:hypothetical protein